MNRIVRCKKAHKTILATGHAQEFEPDQEPFEEGKRKYVPEFEADVKVGVHWCPKCDRIVDAWVEDAPYEKPKRRVK